MTQSEDADVRLHIINLREERQNILTEAVAEYSETLARRLIEKITVYDEKLVVEFKSGLTV